MDYDTYEEAGIEITDDMVAASKVAEREIPIVSKSFRELEAIESFVRSEQHFYEMSL